MAPDLGVDSIKDDIDLFMIELGQTITLPFCGGIASGAVVEVEQECGVAGLGAEEIYGLVGEVLAEVHIRIMGRIKIFKIIDDGDIAIKFAEEKRGTEPGMANDEVRLDIRPGGESLINGVGVPDGIFKSAGTVMIVLSGPALELVGDAFNACCLGLTGGGDGLGNEGGPPAIAPDKLGGDMTKLGREVLMNEENVQDSESGLSDRRWF